MSSERLPLLQQTTRILGLIEEENKAYPTIPLTLDGACSAEANLALLATHL